MYLGTLNLEGCNSTGNMFYNCTSLNTINNIKFLQNENVVSFGMFYNCTNLDINHIDFTNVRFNSTGNMFNGCLGFNINVANKLFSEVNRFTVCAGAFARTGINNLFDFEQSSYQYNCSSLFYGCDNLTNINYNMYRNMRNIQSMFAECQNLQTVNFGLGSNVYNLASMFSECTNLTSVNLTTHINDTTPVISTQSMFSKCTNLTHINITSQTNNIRYENTSSMFSGCTNLTSIDFASNLFEYTESTASMFSGCTNLASIGGMSDINLNNCASISSMFYNCFNLTGSINLNVLSPELGYSIRNVFANSGFEHIALNINSIETASYTINISNIISGCDNLKTFDLSANAVITNDRSINTFLISSSSLPNLTDVNVNVNVNSRSTNYGVYINLSTSNTFKNISANINSVNNLKSIRYLYRYMYNLSNISTNIYQNLGYFGIQLYQGSYPNIHTNIHNITLNDYSLYMERLNTDNITNIYGINVSNLFSITMSYCNNISDLNIVGNNTNMVDINIQYCPTISSINVTNINNIQNIRLVWVDDTTDITINLTPNTNIQNRIYLYSMDNIVNLDIDWTNISYLNNLYISSLLNLSNQSVDNILGGLCNVEYGSGKNVSDVFVLMGITKDEFEQYYPNYNKLINSGWSY